jgi:hypothetical protein
MDFLRTRGFYGVAVVLERSIHIGSGDPAKGPPKPHTSRDFAAVVAQTAATPRVFSILSTYSIK